MARNPTIIKKYGNRRLYDTDESRYVTLDELALKLRNGDSLRVVDAKTGEDLTQATLTQIIIEGRQLARLLPVPLLEQLIRLGDDALAEFFGRYVTSALEIYLTAKRGARAVTPYNPFAQLPFAATDALARLWMSSPLGRGVTTPPPVVDDAFAEPHEEHASRDDVAELRRELDELKRTLQDAHDSDTKPKAKAKRRRKPTGR